MSTELSTLIELHAGELKFEFQTDLPTFIIPVDRLMRVVNALKTAGFSFLTDICGVHYPELDQLAVVYHLHDMRNRKRIRLKVFVSVSHPVVPSMVSVFASANWMERETYDFFGVQFEGHPNLIRILNIDEMTDFPMRKEFALEDPTRIDKKDDYFGR